MGPKVKFSKNKKSLQIIILTSKIKVNKIEYFQSKYSDTNLMYTK